MTEKDKSPNAFAWLEQHSYFQGPLLVWAKLNLSKDATCRTMWLTIPHAGWLMNITHDLKTANNYEKVRVWFCCQSFYISSDLFREKCAELGCYGEPAWLLR